MKQVILHTDRLQNGTFVTRPVNSCGTCGFSPFPWTMATGKNVTVSQNQFLLQHADKMAKLGMTYKFTVESFNY